MKHHFGTGSVLFTVHQYSWDHCCKSVQFPTFAYHQLNQFFSQSYMHRPNSAFNTLGDESYLAIFFHFPSFSESSQHLLPVKYHIHVWQMLPQISCGDTCQIWMWFKEPITYTFTRLKISHTEKLTIFQRTFLNAFSWMKMYELHYDFTEVCSQPSN